MRRVVLTGLCVVAALGLGSALDVDPSGHPTRTRSAPESPARLHTNPIARADTHAATPILWVHADAAHQTAASRVASVAASLLSTLLGETVEASMLDQAPSISWRPADEHSDRLTLGLDLNALRLDRPDLFEDQSLNNALLALGLANARGVVLDFGLGDARAPGGGSVVATFSFRDWDADQSASATLSGGRPPRLELALDGRVSIRPRWTEWIDACLAAHRARLDPLRRSPFEAELASWRRRHEQKLRQVTASLEGPIVIGGDQGEPLVLVGIGPRADARLLHQNLSVVLGAVGEVSLDARAGVGTLSLPTLAATEFHHLEWRLIEADGRRWMLLTRQGQGESIAARITQRGRE